MLNNSFIRVDEVARELDVSKPYAYKLIRQLNDELKAKGFITIAGRVNRQYSMERLYGAERKRIPAYKNKDGGSWYVVTQYTDWTGERKQKCKRSFGTKREALEWEQKFQQQNAGDLDMTVDAFYEIYSNDLKARLKESTWQTKDNIIRTKILPYFEKRQASYLGYSWWWWLCTPGRKQNKATYVKHRNSGQQRTEVQHKRCVSS